MALGARNIFVREGGEGEERREANDAGGDGEHRRGAQTQRRHRRRSQVVRVFTVHCSTHDMSSRMNAYCICIPAFNILIDVSCRVEC